MYPLKANTLKEVKLPKQRKEKRKTDRPSDRQTKRHIYLHAYTHTYPHARTHTHIKKDGWMGSRQAGRQTDGQAPRQTDTPPAAEKLEIVQSSTKFYSDFLFSCTESEF